MRAALCDDENVFRNEIYELLTEYSRARHIDIVCDQYADGRELLPCADRYDIIFMDYQMNNLNGMETSRKIRALNNNCIIIFISAFPEVALDAFEVDTFRFLSKPIDREKFFRAMDDYLKSIDLDNLIVIRSDDVTYTLKASDIIYAEAKLKHCIIRTTDNTYEIATHLKTIERQLPPDRFTRCQRSYIAGFAHIKTHTSKEIIFDNGEKATIGKTYFADFKSAFQDYILKHNEGQL